MVKQLTLVYVDSTEGWINVQETEERLKQEPNPYNSNRWNRINLW